jgi:hypothetical protein
MKYNKEFINQLEFLCGTKLNDMQRDSIIDFLKRNDKKHESKTMRSQEWSSAVEELYAKYPAKCVVRKVSTGKNNKCKEKLSKLLEKHSQATISAAIDFYVKECKEGNVYMKNFLTYLNNFHIEENVVRDNSNDAIQVLHQGKILYTTRKEAPAGSIILR